MKKFLYLISILIVSVFIACTNDNTFYHEDINKDEELTSEALMDEDLKTEMSELETSGTSPELLFLLSSIFSEGNENKIITTRFDFNEKNDGRILTSRYETENDLLNASCKILKNREEGNNKEWIYWGEVCGIMSAKKFVDFLEEKFKNKTYETRFEPIPGKKCRKAYYRAG